MIGRNSLIIILIILSGITTNVRADVLCNVSGQVTVVHADKCPSKSKKINFSSLLSPTVGIKGDIGAAGKTGKKGDTGDTGPKGPKGDKGAQGSQGATGSKGARGDVGSTGPKGVIGDTGDRGSTGAKGAQGPKGDAGSGPGPRGLDGSKGPRGPQGEAGIKGPRGNPGLNGTMAPMTSCLIWPEVSTAAITADPNSTQSYDDTTINVTCPTVYPFLWKHSFNASNWDNGAPLKTPPLVKFKLATRTVLLDTKNYTFPNGLEVTLRLSKINGQFEKGNYLADLVCCAMQ